ncbi:MAG TPA: TIGR03435 family protein [Terriglobia bacterium]|nr:TIGR03435 family protein [Terriglobia bacterium]
MNRFLVVVLMAGVAFGQTSAPTFESADVRVSAPVANPTLRGGAIRGGRFELRTATMVDLISMAYSTESNKVLGGPSWLDWDRFDVVAQVPSATTYKDLNLMLQQLLADRFKLTVHKDTKLMPAFVLSAGKTKPNMKEATETGDPGGCQGQPQNPAPGTVPYQVVSCHNMTMAMFADELRNFGGGTYISDPVVDQTGLKGAWNFDLKWTARNRLAQAGADAITLFDAIDKQLGLKLEAQNAPLPVLVVDSVNQKPTPTPPGMKIPEPLPAEFEVATIKPTAPGVTGQNGRLQNGRLDLQNFTLKQMIQLAWELGNNDEFLVGLPKSAESEHWDVAGKAVSAGTSDGQDIDFDTLRLMLQGLLAERFGLKAHMEERPVSAYTMTATKETKLQKADPQYRTNCKSGAGPTPILNRQITCQNTNMTQFAGTLQNMVSGYVRAPVKDATGIEGSWDFSFSFSGVNLLPGAAFDPNNTTGRPSDPNGSLTMPEALQKQLGLKLTLEKRPLPVLVVDQVEDKPTDN